MMPCKQLFFRLSVVYGALAVVAGAFGAHMLKKVLTADQLSSWRTAVLYMFLHTVVMLILSSHPILKGRYIRTALTLFGVGILLFSGSIMLLTLQDILGVKLAWLGPITPIGGVLFIAGWLCLLKVDTTEAH